MTGSYELFLADAQKLVTFDVASDDKLSLRSVEKSLGTSMRLEALDFSLGDIVTSHSADGKSVYVGKFGPFGAQGLGVKLEEDGKFSAGYFVRGKLNGVCKVTLPKDDIFIGNMHEDFPEGEGLFYDSQRKAWLYGYFKNFECITLLKDDIVNAVPYKRRIFTNQFEKSRTCDRCAVEILLVDFAKDFFRKFEPHMLELDDMLLEKDQILSNSPSQLEGSQVETKDDTVRAKEAVKTSQRPQPLQIVTLTEPKGKDTYRAFAVPRKASHHKKSSIDENAEKVTADNRDNKKRSGATSY